MRIYSALGTMLAISIGFAQDGSAVTRKEQVIGFARGQFSQGPDFKVRNFKPVSKSRDSNGNRRTTDEVIVHHKETIELGRTSTTKWWPFKILKITTVKDRRGNI